MGIFLLLHPVTAHLAMAVAPALESTALGNMRVKHIRVGCAKAALRQTPWFPLLRVECRSPPSLPMQPFRAPGPPSLPLLTLPPSPKPLLRCPALSSLSEAFSPGGLPSCALPA